MEFHWVFFLVVLLIGALIQAYFDPLGYIGLG